MGRNSDDFWPLWNWVSMITPYWPKCPNNPWNDLLGSLEIIHLWLKIFFIFRDTPEKCTLSDWSRFPSVYSGRPRCMGKVTFIIVYVLFVYFLRQLFVLESSFHFIVLLFEVSSVSSCLTKWVLQGASLGVRYLISREIKKD